MRVDVTAEEGAEGARPNMPGWKGKELCP